MYRIRISITKESHLDILQVFQRSPSCKLHQNAYLCVSRKLAMARSCHKHRPERKHEWSSASSVLVRRE